MIKKLTLIILPFLLLSISLYAQVGNSVKIADQHYSNYSYDKALEFYTKANEKTPNNLYINSKIGNCYKYKGKIAEAEKYYEFVTLNKNSENIYKFYYAQSLMANRKYTKALNTYNEYYISIGQPENQIPEFNNNIFTKDENLNIVIENFNSKYSDYSPIKIKNKLYFISNRENETIMGRENVWSLQAFSQMYKIDLNKEKKPKSPKIHYKNKSKKYHEGPMGWDRSKEDLYVTRSFTSTSKANSKGKNKINLKIFKIAYIPEKKEFGTTFIDNISFDNNNYSVAYPTISKDGRYMIFASDMPGGIGDLDLYVAEYLNGNWVNPINLGSKINTPGNEAFPFLMPDGLLYFSSDGHLGIGGYDIFSAKLLEDGSFDLPKNLRLPINSDFDDFGFSISDNYYEGYFSSNRPSKYGKDDIYSFKKKTKFFETTISDLDTKLKIDSARISFYNLDKDEKFVKYTDNEGNLKTQIQAFTNYQIIIQKKGYIADTAIFKTVDDDVSAEINLEKDFGILLEVKAIDFKTGIVIPNVTVVLSGHYYFENETNKTNASGKTLFMLDEEIEYNLKLSTDFSNEYIHLTKNKTVSTHNIRSPKRMYENIKLKKVTKNKEIIIDDFVFDKGEYLLRFDAEDELEKLVQLLQDNKDLQIELSSHSDCRGTKAYNFRLTSLRAESAINYLIKNGVSYKRLSSTGYGESQIRNGCFCEGAVKSDCTEQEHQVNNRMTFSILKFD